MAFCANCGASVEGRFCAKCGTQVDAGAPMGASGVPPPGAQSYGPGAGTAVQSGGLTENVAAALSYLFGLITGVLFLAIAPYNQSRTVRFHAWQSIFFNVGLFVFWIAYTIVTIILPSFLSLILSLASLLIWLGTLCLWLLLMYKAYNNEKFKLPIIGDLAEKQA